MRNSRLLELLRRLTPQEHQRLRSFVTSPYFSRGEQSGQIIALLDFCLAAIDGNADSGPEKSEAYAAVFPGEAFVAGKLEKRMSALLGLLQQFLVVEEYLRTEHEMEHQLVLATEFQKRSLPARTGAVLKNARYLLNNTVRRDAVYYEREIKLLGQEIDHQILHSTFTGKALFNQAFEALFMYYHSVKQGYAVALMPILNRSSYELSSLSKRMLSEEPIPSEFIKISPILYFGSRYTALLSQPKPNMDALQQFIQDLRREEHLLKPDDLKNGWTMVRNILIKWWNIHKSMEVAKICFDVYAENASQGFLYHFDKVFPSTLEAFCKIAFELGRLDAAHQIIQEHRGRISGEPYEEPYYFFNLAKYHFYKGDLDKALDLLPQAMPDNTSQMHTKILEIQILYEIQSDLLPYRMDAFRMFLNRTASRLHPPIRLRDIRLFLSHLGRICRCRAGDARRSASIIAKIKADPSTIEYYWLLKVAAALAVRK